MKIRLDENIPARLASVLERLGRSVESVATDRLQGLSDEEVWKAAREEGAFFVDPPRLGGLE